METPLQIEVHGFELSSHVQDLVAAHLRKMEERFGRSIACRLVIRAPGAHHQMGEPFSVGIRVALPGGREVNVGRISNSHDPRQADLVFAVNDAFRRAMRQLRRQASKLQDEDKQHIGNPVGRVVRLQPEKSYGFLATEDGREIYFHAHSVLGGRFSKLLPGDRVTYHEEKGEQGPQASTVRVMGGARDV